MGKKKKSTYKKPYLKKAVSVGRNTTPGKCTTVLKEKDWYQRLNKKGKRKARKACRLAAKKK